MTIYNSSVVTNNAGAISHGPYGANKTAIATVTLAAAPTTADTVKFFTIPKGSTIIGYRVGATQMDSNGAPTLAWNIGDTGSATRLFAAVAVGRTAGGSAIYDNGTGATYTGIGYTTTADTQIVAVPSANCATGVAGQTITLMVEYVVVGGPS